MTLFDHLEAFLDACVLDGRGPTTVRNYRSALQQFLRSTKLRSPARLSAAIVDQYLSGAAASVTPATLQLHRSALRSWLRYLRGVGVTTLSPKVVVRPRLAVRPLSALEPLVLQKLLASVTGTSLLALRDRAVLLLLIETGLRVSELTTCNRDAINGRHQHLSVCGRCPRTLSLSAAAVQAITTYVAARTDIDPALIVRHGTNVRSVRTLRLSSRSIERLVSARARMAGLPDRVTPERLRATYTQQLLASTPLPVAQQQLGHLHETSTRRRLSTSE